MRKYYGRKLMALAAVSVSSFLLLTGFDSALTAQDIVQKAQEAEAGLESFGMHIQGEADVSLNLAIGEESQAIPLTGSMDLNAEYVLSPLQMHVTGTMGGDASALGMAGELGVEVFMEAQEDGSGKLYAKVTGVEEAEEEGWQAVRIDEDTMGQLSTAMNSSDIAAISEKTGIDVQAYMDEYLANTTVAPEAVNVNGKDCYELTTTLSGSTLTNLVEQALAAQNSEEIDESVTGIVNMVLAGIQADIVADYDVENFHSVHGSIDFANSDFSILTQLAASFTGGSDEESSTQIDLTVNALNLNYDADYETPVSIEIPAEALVAPVQDLDDLEDLAEEAEEAAIAS